MNIAELFINLGVKGSEKSLGGVLNLQKGLKDTASVSLETKAALVGVMYALERMFAQSSRAGNSLAQFGATMGGHTQELQRYQYVAKQIGSSNDELAATFQNLSSQATDVLLGKGAPETIARVAQVTKAGIGEMERELEKAANGDVVPLFTRLNKYFQTEGSVGYRNKTAKDFGISRPIEAGMIRNKFNDKALASAPTYSDKEISNLDTVYGKWEKLGTVIEMAFGRFNAKHGSEIVDGISKVIPKVVALAEALDKLGTKAGVFQKLGMVFEGWEHIFNGIVAAIEFINKQNAPEAATPEAEEKAKKYLPGEKVPKAELDAQLGKKMRAEMLNDLLNFFQKTLGGGYGESADKTKPTQNLFQPGKVNGATNVEPPSKVKLSLVPPPGLPKASAVAVPPKTAATAAKAAQLVGGAVAPGRDVKVSLTQNFAHPGVDPAKTADSSKKGVKDAYRELSAQGEGG